MKPNLIVASWRKRLVALADDPPYVFRDTPQPLVQRHYRALTTFLGYSTAEIADAEQRLQIQFPDMFKAYLNEMGKQPGDLFCGSDLARISEFVHFRSDALELMAETDPGLSLPADAVVFLSHQGYTFIYILASGGDDGPPMQWTEGDAAPRRVAPTFAQMVDAEIQLMETATRQAKELGGFFRTMREDGSVLDEYPALNDPSRPLKP